jgi:peptide deformylase
MAEQPIVKYGNPVLRQKSKPVSDFGEELKNLVADMLATVRQAQGLGLAAVQIGVLLRVFIVDLTATDITAEPKVFINPEIIATSGEAEYEEGCLSFPGIYQRLKRPATVKVRALDQDGNEFVMEADGMVARAILHEYDHLEGILFIDHFSTVNRALVERKLKKLAKSA